MLADLVRTTSSDASLPAFSSIRLHTAGGQLHGWSTDRFRAGHAVVSVDGELPGPVLLHRSDASTVAKALKGSVEVTVVLADDGHTLTFTGAGQSVTATVTGNENFPNVPKALPTDLPDTPALAAFQPKYLADFAAIGARRKVTQLHVVAAAGMKATAVRIGDDYRGWVMPVADPKGTPDEGPTWLAHCW